MVSYLKSHVKRCYVLNAGEIAEKCGSSRVLNVALMGAMAETGIMDLTSDEIEAVLVKRIKPQFIEMNRQALILGAQSV